MVNQDNTEIGWSKKLALGIQKSTAKYEFGLYKNDELIDVFRTDVKEVAGNLEKEAIKCAEFKQTHDSRSEYYVKKINDRKPLPVVLDC